MMDKTIVKIYTDGSCSPNPGPGGWAAVLIFADGGKVIELHGAEPEATNNRMELLAALKALQSLEHNSVVEVFTDSRYLQRGISEWLAKWQRNGWQTMEGSPVKNRDLWERFVYELERHQVRWDWVKGHAKNTWNCRADELAAAARKKGLPPSLPPNPEEIRIYPAVTWKNSTGSGSWAVILNYRNHYRILGGCVDNTTSNRLYLIAVIEGLRALKRSVPVTIHTRSGYLRDGLDIWLEGWQKRNWRTKEGADISNVDQWQKIAELKNSLAVRVVDATDEISCHGLEAKEIAREFQELQLER